MDQPLKFGFIPIEGGAYYPEFLEEVLLGEQLGFDSVWLEEHHGIRDHYQVQATIPKAVRERLGLSRATG